MLIVHVHVHVRSDCIETFRRATLHNAEASLREPGVVRFDVIQQVDDPKRFLLVEVYRSEADPVLHKQTAHYNAWRESVESMMAEPRHSRKFAAVFPPDARWETAQ